MAFSLKASHEPYIYNNLYSLIIMVVSHRLDPLKGST